METHPETGTRLRFRPDIEGLRAVAILLVVLYHAGWRHAASGFYGVDVFFVLSGFLITGILVDEVARTGTVSLVNFWARRARRLLPAAAFITLVVLIIEAVQETPLVQVVYAGTARAFAVYGSNILFAVRSADYFAGAAARDPLLHTWSLSVEEQFYLFFAPLMLGLAAWALKRGVTAFRRRLAAIAVVLSVLSFAGCVLVVRRYPVIAFYSLPARAWEFGLGAMAVFGAAMISRVRRPWLEAIGLVALIGLVASATLAHGEGRPPLGALTLLPTLCAVGLILTGAAAQPTLVARFLSIAPMRLIGQLSYSWYLWHWPMLVLLRANVRQPSTHLALVVAGLSLIPAAATYAWIESPIRFSKRLRSRTKQVVIGAVALAGVTYGAATLAIIHADWVLHSPQMMLILDALVKVRTYDDGCQVPLLATVSPPCVYGPGTNDTTVVLFGDSHAAHWFPAVDSVATLRGWKLVNLTKTGCPTVAVELNNLGRRYVECDSWRAYAIKRIVDLRPILVIISDDRSYNVVFQRKEYWTDTNAVARREWTEGITRTLDALVPSGARLVTLADTPNPQVDVPICLMMHRKNPARCDASPTIALNPSFAAAIREAVRAVPGATVVSLNSFICDRTSCPVLRNGIVRYRDGSHLSVRFAASLAPALSHVLTGVLAEHRPAR